MVAIIGRFKRKPILTITFTLLILCIMASGLGLTNYSPKPYPNLERVHSETFTLGSFISGPGSEGKLIVDYSEDTTFDSYQVVYNWYKKQDSRYDYTHSSGDYGHINRQSNYHLLPNFILVRTGNQVIISECSGTKTTCVATTNWFSIKFIGLFGEALEKLLKWF